MRNCIYILETPSQLEKAKAANAFCIDLGWEVATVYSSSDCLKVEMENLNGPKGVEKIIESKIPEGCERIIFLNVGILLEKELGIAVSNFFLDLARVRDVFLYWPEEDGMVVDNRRLVWNVESVKNKIEFDRGVLIKWEELQGE